MTRLDRGLIGRRVRQVGGDLSHPLLGNGFAQRVFYKGLT